MPTSIVGTTFARLRHASTDEEAAAIVQQIIAEHTTGAGSLQPTRAHHRTTGGVEDYGEMAVHHMTQPQWVSFLQQALEEGNLDRLAAYYEAATWEQAVAIITGLLEAHDTNANPMHHHARSAFTKAMEANDLQLRRYADALGGCILLQAVFYMMWHLPRTWASIGPGDWATTGALARRFEACVQQLPACPPAPSAGVVVLALACRWNRNVHFRRYGAFHVADTCHFAEPVEGTCDVGATQLQTTMLGRCEAYVRRVQQAPLAYVRTVRGQMLGACGNCWSSMPFDTLRSHAERVVVVQLLSLEARLDDDTSFVAWASDVLRAPGYDVVHDLLAVAIGVHRPWGALFQSNDALLVESRAVDRWALKQRASDASECSVTSQREAWLSVVTAAKGAPGSVARSTSVPPAFEAVVHRYTVGMEFLKEKKTFGGGGAQSIGDPAEMKPCAIAQTTCAPCTVFLAAIFRWLWQSTGQQVHTNAHEQCFIDYCTPAFEAFNTPAVRDVFVAGFLDCTRGLHDGDRGVHDGASPLDGLAAAVAPIVHTTMWWCTQPGAALELLMELCRSDEASHVCGVAKCIAARCARSMAEWQAFDDNEGDLIDGAVPLWLASFLSDPLTAPASS